MERETGDIIQPADMVLVYVDGRPGFFARVEELLPDVKPGWWHVRLLPLGMDNLGYETIVWILDEDQVRGADYTMSGIPMRIEKIPPYRTLEPRTALEGPEVGKKKVLTLVDRRKKES